MTETLETLAAGDVVETRMGHRYHVLRIKGRDIEGRDLAECGSIKHPDFDPYTFPVEALRKAEVEA